MIFKHIYEYVSFTIIIVIDDSNNIIILLINTLLELVHFIKLIYSFIDNKLLKNI